MYKLLRFKFENYDKYLIFIVLFILIYFWPDFWKHCPTCIGGDNRDLSLKIIINI